METAFLFDAPREATDTSWVQVAKTGSFEDPRYGKFKITTTDFARWQRNFQQLILSEGRLGLPVDVDHSPEKRGETEAVGWVKELEQRGDQLWGKVEWNDLGRELVGQKRYAYISPSYSGNYKDETGQPHGTALLGIALTNRPFLQMATVNLSRFTFAAPANDNDADDVGLEPSDTTALATEILDVSDPVRQKTSVITKKVGGRTRHMFPIPAGDKVHARLAKAFVQRAIDAGHITEQEGATVRARADEVLGEKSYSHRQMDANLILTSLNLTREQLKLAADADDATVLAAIADHQKSLAAPTPPAAVPEGQVTLTQEQVTTLLADANAGRAAAEELRVTRFESAFDKALSRGRAVPAQKDTFKALYDADAANAVKLLDELQPVVNMEPQGQGASPADLGALGAQLAGEFTDSVTPMGIDQDALRLHTAAVELERTRKIPYAEALSLAESGVTV